MPDRKTALTSIGGSALFASPSANKENADRLAREPPLVSRRLDVEANRRVPLVTRVFVELVVVVSPYRIGNGERPCQDDGIVDHELVLDRVIVDARESLDRAELIRRRHEFRGRAGH